MSTNRIHITEKLAFGGSTLPPTWRQITNDKYEPISKTPLFTFKFPSEILVEIVSLIGIPSLSNLALVDWDCCQLARSGLFSSFKFDYSDASQKLVDLLEGNKETRVKSSSTGTKPNHYLGSCIRRIFLGHNSKVYSHDEDPFTFPFNESPEEQSRKAAARAQRIEVYEAYVGRLRSVISSSHALPNLEVVDWDSREVISQSESRFQSFYSNPHQLKIPHLKFDMFCIDYDFVFNASDPGWPIRSLCMKMKLSKGTSRNQKSPLLSSLLRQRASSVEMLALMNCSTQYFASFGPDSTGLPRFPNLRIPDLQNIWFPDSTTWDVLFAAPAMTMTCDLLMDIQSSTEYECSTLRGTFKFNTVVFNSGNILLQPRPCDDSITQEERLHRISRDLGFAPYLFLEQSKNILPVGSKPPDQEVQLLRKDVFWCT
jgi:hypothetical protein